MSTRKKLIIAIFFTIAFSSNALSNEYNCTVVWAAGEYTGAGDSIGDAIHDARNNCNSDHVVTEHECGTSPVNVNCLDDEGKCVSHAEFLQHGLIGGDACS